MTLISPVAEWFRWTLDADKRSLRLCHRCSPAAVWGIRLWCQWARHDVKLSRSKLKTARVVQMYSWASSVAQSQSHSGVRSANLRIPYRPRKILTVCFDVVRGKGIYAKSTILWGFSGIWHQLFLLFGFARVGMVLNRWFYSSFRELVTSSWSVIPL